jgi:NADH dehydrogenase [ubiquinone] 1 alpha subcomplex assembly factor 7
MPEHHPEPERSIRRAIERHGPISFAEFMELALYGPHGFYQEPPVGEHGHFVTSPHVHPLFGWLVGRAIRFCVEPLAMEQPPAIVEVGAGDGTLAAQVRPELGEHRYVAIERGAGARDVIAQRMPDVEVAASLEALDQHVDGVVFANELLDNLPFRWIRRDDLGDLQEVLVDLRDGRLAPVEQPFAKEDVEGREAVPETLPPGTDGVIPEGALHFVERLARVLRCGYAVFVDYGASAAAEVHGYRQQRVVADVLDHPGSADITAGVDFAMLEERATKLGVRSFGTVSQRSALTALGYEDWTRRERDRQRDAQDRRSGRHAVMTWSGRNAAASLIDPGGLGRLRWWLVATSGLERPDWFVAAQARDHHTRTPTGFVTATGDPAAD